MEETRFRPAREGKALDGKVGTCQAGSGEHSRSQACPPLPASTTLASFIVCQAQLQCDLNCLLLF